ncbi:MAG: LysR family transcriptional regulator [Woeseiaceae bacterium]|nr:LysR family transcriptional regulator [Woeseiaceae bacterium]
MKNSNRNISLREWRTFCAVAERLSFRDAAEQLFVTASAVSHQVKNLETELGRKLFERGTREIALTRDGELLFADLKPAMDELEAITRRHRSAAPKSMLKISVQPFFASELFVPRLPEFQKLNEAVEISVDTSSVHPEKFSLTADASIRIFDTPPEGHIAEPLFPLRLVPAGTDGFYDSVKVKAGRIVSDFPIIIHDKRPSAWQQWEKSAGISLPRNARTLTMDSMVAVARAAQRGLGAALVPTFSESWFRDSSFVALFDHELETDDTYYFVTRNDRAEDPNVRLLRDWVLRNFGART